MIISLFLQLLNILVMVAGTITRALKFLAQRQQVFLFIVAHKFDFVLNS